MMDRTRWVRWDCLLGAVLVLAMAFVLLGPKVWGQVLENVGMVTLVRSLDGYGSQVDPDGIERAQTLLRRAVERSNLGWRGLGFVLAAQGREEEAIAAWENEKGIADEFMRRGNHARWDQRFEEALTWYTRAARIYPGWAEPWYGLAVIHENLSTWETAVPLYRWGLEQASDNRDIWYGLGKAYWSRRQWDLALQSFEQGLASEMGQVGFSVSYFYVGRIRQDLLSSVDLEGAWAAYAQALARDDYMPLQWLKAETHHQRGRILAEREIWDDAAEEYRQALILNPSHYWAHFALSEALWQLKDRAGAKAALQQAIDLQPDQKQAYQRLGNFYRLEGDVIQARTMYRKVLELDPQDQGAQQALEALEKVEPQSRPLRQGIL